MCWAGADALLRVGRALPGFLEGGCGGGGGLPTRSSSLGGLSDISSGREELTTSAMSALGGGVPTWVRLPFLDMGRNPGRSDPRLLRASTRPWVLTGSSGGFSTSSLFWLSEAITGMYSMSVTAWVRV